MVGHVGVASSVLLVDSVKVLDITGTLYLFLLNIVSFGDTHMTLRFLAVFPSSGKLVCISDRSLF